MLATNAFADVTAFHVGTYSRLYTLYTQNNEGSKKNYLDALKDNMGTYGVALNGCDSSGGDLAVSSSYVYCTMANWYNTNYEYSDTSVFCFSTQDLCRKFSGRLYDGTQGNKNSKTQLTKGYKLSDTNITYILSSNKSDYQRTVTITNDEFFQCLRDCPTQTGFTTETKSDGTIYEQNLNKYCSSNTASTCGTVNSSTARTFRCPAEYYNEQGTAASTGSLSTLTCRKCPSLPKRDGTECAISQPLAGYGRDITTCGLMTGCESFDDTGDFVLDSQCFYTK